MDAATLVRFNSKYVMLQNGCWQWQKAKVKGYGVMNVSGSIEYAHILSYEHYVGKVPAKKELDHICMNKACCNYEHVEPVTHRINMQRARHAIGLQTHCKHGHELTSDNVFQGKKQRFCKICASDRQRTYRRKKRGMKHEYILSS